MLGPYRLTRRIARGGFATVYAGFHEDAPGLPLAIKVLDTEGSEAPTSVEKFRQEGRLGHELEHRNLVRVEEAGEIDGRLFIAMELLEGATLRELIEGGPMPAGAVVGLALQLLAGLAHAHDGRGRDGTPLRLVHRDIKPSNLFLTSDGIAKVIDFGIARVYESYRTVTRSGVFLGTLAYAAPEQARNEPIDARADLFSLGLVLHELVTGRRVFDQKHEAAIVSALLFNPIPRLGSLVPPAVDAAIAWTLSPDRDQRVPSAAALMDTLRDALPAEQVWPEARLATLVSRRQSPALNDVGRFGTRSRELVPPPGPRLKQRGKPEWKRWGLVPTLAIPLAVLLVVGRASLKHEPAEDKPQEHVQPVPASTLAVAQPVSVEPPKAATQSPHLPQRSCRTGDPARRSGCRRPILDGSTSTRVRPGQRCSSTAWIEAPPLCFIRRWARARTFWKRSRRTAGAREDG